MASILYVLATTPFLLSRYLLDITLCLLPSGRPVRTWTIKQAVSVRTVRLLLRYASLLEAGDRLTLLPGPEGDRFEIIQPQARKLYQGPLDDAFVQPQAIGATWTPARPSQAAIEDSKTTVTLHLHGGAFVVGQGRDKDMGYMARALLRHMGCTYVYAPQYRLSSSKDSPFPAQLQDAVTSYLHLIRVLGIPASRIIVSGDSAGGNIVIGFLRYISEYGEQLDIPAPAAAALWSPWTDVSTALNTKMDVRMSPNYATDYLNPKFPNWGARTLTDNGRIDVSGPYISPLHHPFKLSAQIPVFVNVGERELLFDQVMKFRTVFEAQGWSMSLVVSIGCPHDPLLLGPRMGFHEEAERAVREARAFFSGATALPLKNSSG
ncbi:Alpha/Beta hydrolase protein [Xylaria sp. CBS 124048]|nr:Alpha/Beta hydrolase protein [Xylaria sp. CBS 124048]